MTAAPTLLRVKQLRFDERNPRLSSPNEGQEATFRAMVEWDEHKTLALAKDITDEESTDPSSLPIVMPSEGEKGAFTVLDGNRRLCALRALEAPEELEDTVDPATLRSLRTLSKAFGKSPVTEIYCWVAKDRKQAEHWIDLKHAGSRGGAGTEDWGTTEKANFRALTGKTKPLYIQLYEWLRAHDEVKRDDDFPVTTFQRLIANPEVRGLLGVELQQGQLHFRLPETKARKQFKPIISDLISRKKDARSLNTKKEQTDYVRGLPSRVDQEEMAAPGEGKPTRESKGGASRATATRKARRKTPKPRAELIPTDCNLDVKHKRLAAIEQDLRDISMEKHPNAVSVLYRVFVEMSVDEYVQREKVPLAGDARRELGPRMLQVARHLESKQRLTEKERRAIDKASTERLLATTMNAYVHNQHVFPSAGDLRASWDTIQPFMVALWAP